MTAAATQRLAREIALNREFVDEKEVAFLSLAWTWLRIERTGRQFFSSFGITDAQFNALMILWDYRRTPLQQKELAELLVVNPASLGGVVDRMQLKGWVRREDDPADRRAYFVRLTETGISKLKEVRGPYYKLLDAAFEGFENRDLGNFIDFNDKFRSRLDGYAAQHVQRERKG
ncbi:MAG: MarR family transcriptional regulator [Usitatibacter sp.]